MKRGHPYKTHIGTLHGVDYWVYFDDHTTQRAYLEDVVRVAQTMLSRLPNAEKPKWVEVRYCDGTVVWEEPANDAHGYGHGD